MGLNMSLGAAAAQYTSSGRGGAAALKEFQHRVVTVGAAVPPFCWSDVRCQTSKKLPPSAILSTSHTSHGTVMMLCSGSIASLKDRKGSCGVARGCLLHSPSVQLT